jgi:hypothetical protein
VMVDRLDFSEEVCGVDQARKEDKGYFSFGLTEEVARPITHSLSTNRRGSDCLGWPRLVRVGVSSTNTCPPPKAAAYSASATDALHHGYGYALAEGMERALLVTGGGVR